MVIENSGAAQGAVPSTASLERALRWIGTRRHQKPYALLVHAIEEPNGESADVLATLVALTESLPTGTAETRALAAWGLLIDLVNKIGPTSESRRRNTLIAAFRLPRRPEVTRPWKSTLDSRFGQLVDLPGVFGNPSPSTTTPMHKAWNRAVHDRLAPMLHERLAELAVDGDAWVPYVEIARQTEAELARDQAIRSEPQDLTTGYRTPSKGAQPVFLDLFITTVFMKRRAVYRRITERLITAREDNVESYIARALAGSPGDPPNVPVRALWGCCAEPLVTSHSDKPILTRLRFPKPLRRGERHYFSSEAIDENITEERLGVNVEVDHHGIAPGKLLHSCVPVSGLTIRIRFDEECLPEACWWYAEQTERERREPPPHGDSRWLPITQGGVEHTFTGKCQPRESYGVSFLWPVA